MSSNKGFFAKLLDLITYKEKPQPEEFVIPDASVFKGNGEKPGEDNPEGGKSTGDKPTGDKPSGEKPAEEKPGEAKAAPSGEAGGEAPKKSGKQGIKKPLTLEELKNGTSGETKKKSPAADENVISTAIKENVDFIHAKFNFPTNKDIVVREFVAAESHKAFMAYIDGMSDKATINNFIMRPLMTLKLDDEQQSGCVLDYIHEHVLEINQTKKVTNHTDAVSEILMGNTILYIDGCNFYISCETKGFDKRSVGSPETEGVVKGPQQGFNENLKTNITLLRRIIKNNSLTSEFLKVGERSNTMCAVVYIRDLANPAIVEEVKRRIGNVKTDFLASAGMLEQMIEDNPLSIIPTILTTERPDRAASHLFEGKVAVFIDGTPFTMIIPVSIFSLLHSPEDAALKWQVSSVMRLIRLIAIGIATFLPGLYMAITTFHREMIPTDILIAIARAKENVPFPSFVEILLMEFSFELIREAGIRIPGIIGNTIGIIGALILGQAAVEANLVNPVLIIVIAVTGLGNFAIPNFTLASSIRLLRFPFILAGAYLGFYGIALGVVVLMTSLVSHKSFGVPYMAPLSPKAKRSKDLLFRWPVWVQELRPDYVNSLDERRQPHISRQWSMQKPAAGGDDKSDE